MKNVLAQIVTASLVTIVILTGFITIYNSSRPIVITQKEIITTTVTYTHDCTLFATLVKIYTLLSNGLNIYFYEYDDTLLKKTYNIITQLISDAQTKPDTPTSYVNALLHAKETIENVLEARYSDAETNWFSFVSEVQYLGYVTQCS